MTHSTTFGVMVVTALLSHTSEAALLGRSTIFDDQFNNAQKAFNLSRTAVIAIAIAAIVLFILKIILVTWCCARVRRRRRLVAQGRVPQTSKPGAPSAYSPPSTYYTSNGQAFGPSPYGAAPPVRGPNVRPPSADPPPDAYQQQQQLFAAYARPAPPAAVQASMDDEASRPLLAPEPETDRTHESAPSVLMPTPTPVPDVPPPAYELSPAHSEGPSPGPSAATGSSGRLGSSGGSGSAGGGDVRREGKRGVILEYQADGRQ